MQFVYKPEGAEPRRWEFDPARLMSPEIEVIERHTGLEYGEWIEAVGRTSVLAIHGLLFVLLKRNTPTLKWDEVQFCMAEIEFEMTDDEKGQLLEHLEALENPTDAERATIAELRKQGTVAVEAGKA